MSVLTKLAKFLSIFLINTRSNSRIAVVHLNIIWKPSACSFFGYFQPLRVFYFLFLIQYCHDTNKMLHVEKQLQHPSCFSLFLCNLSVAWSNGSALRSFSVDIKRFCFYGTLTQIRDLSSPIFIIECPTCFFWRFFFHWYRLKMQNRKSRTVNKISISTKNEYFANLSMVMCVAVALKAKFRPYLKFPLVFGPTFSERVGDFLLFFVSPLSSFFPLCFFVFSNWSCFIFARLLCASMLKEILRSIK